MAVLEEIVGRRVWLQECEQGFGESWRGVVRGAVQSAPHMRWPSRYGPSSLLLELDVPASFEGRAWSWGVVAPRYAHDELTDLFMLRSVFGKARRGIVCGLAFCEDGCGLDGPFEYAYGHVLVHLEG